MNIMQNSQKHRFSLFIIWLCAIAFYMYTRMISTSISAFAIPLGANFNYSSLEIAWAISAYSTAMLIMKIPVGIIVDRYGIDIPLAIAMLIVLSGTCIFAFPINISILLSSRFIIGIGAAFAMMSAYRLTSIVLSKKLFALATGIIYFCGSLAVSLSGSPLNTAVSNYSFANIVLSLALILVIIITIYIFAYKNHGILPKANHIRSFSDYFKGLSSVFKNKQICISILYTSLFTCVFFNTIGYWGNTILLNTKLDNSIQAGLIGNSIASISSGVMSIIVGAMISLQWLRKSHITISSILTTIALIIMFYLPISNIYILCISSAIVGIGFGYTGISFDTINKCNQAYLVSSLSLMFFFEYILNILINPFVAYIQQTTQTISGDTTFSYHVAYSIFIFLMLIVNILSCYTTPQKA